MKAVKRPGSLYFSADLMTLSQAARKPGDPGRNLSAFGNLPRENESMISSAALTPLSPPAWTRSYQRLPVGSASISGLPEKRAGKKPMLSEWSATTRKSSGRESLTLRPADAVTSSPRAKRYASSLSSRVPKAPASRDALVCRWVSPQKTRVGKLRPA